VGTIYVCVPCQRACVCPVDIPVLCECVCVYVCVCVCAVDVCVPCTTYLNPEICHVKYT